MLHCNVSGGPLYAANPKTMANIRAEIGACNKLNFTKGQSNCACSPIKCQTAHTHARKYRAQRETYLLMHATQIMYFTLLHFRFDSWIFVRLKFAQTES